MLKLIDKIHTKKEKVTCLLSPTRCNQSGTGKGKKKPNLFIHPSILMQIAVEHIPQLSRGRTLTFLTVTPSFGVCFVDRLYPIICLASCSTILGLQTKEKG